MRKLRLFILPLLMLGVVATTAACQNVSTENVFDERPHRDP